MSPSERLAAALAGKLKLFGLSPNGNSKGISSIPGLSTQLGHSVDVVNIFMGWQQPLPVASLNAIVALGAVPELTLEQWPAGGGVDQPLYANSVVTSGTYDGYLTSLASAVHAWGAPLLLRYAHEMNGNWYPWAASVNGNTPASYVASWRHVHDIFVRAGATNVLWVWSPNAGGPTPITDVYPGDDYIDIIGMDGYNRGNGTSGYQSPASVFGSLLTAVHSVAPSKPVLINETGTSELAGDKAGWLEQLFVFVRAQSTVIGIVYSDFGNWVLNSSPQALAGAATGLGQF